MPEKKPTLEQCGKRVTAPAWRSMSWYREVISEQPACPEPSGAAELQATAHYLYAMAPFRLLRSLRESSDQALGERNQWQRHCQQLKVEADQARGEWRRWQANCEQLQ